MNVNDFITENRKELEAIFVSMSEKENPKYEMVRIEGICFRRERIPNTSGYTSYYECSILYNARDFMGDWMTHEFRLGVLEAIEQVKAMKRDMRIDSILDGE